MNSNGVHRAVVYANAPDGVYRKLVLSKGRLIGALAVGEWPDADRVQNAVAQKERLWPWQVARFRRTGHVWRPLQANNVNAWPAQATVCQCTGVTRGTLSAACQQGCNTVEALSLRTGAGTVCLSCRPLLAQLLNQDTVAATEGVRSGLLIVALITIGLVITGLMAGPVPYSTSIFDHGAVDRLWLNSFTKQVSGYTLLGIISIGLLLSLRKRWRRLRVGQFATWRTAHGASGVLSIIALTTHTGAHLGERLNFALMLCLLGICIAGGIAAVLTACEHRFGMLSSSWLRERCTQVHWLLFWPLPVLLGFHILAGYYF